MDLGRECLSCGQSFVGSARRRYCSPKCRDRTNNQKRRLRALRINLEHARKQGELAKLNDDAMNQKFWSWRARQLQSDLFVLTSVMTS